MQLSMIHLKVYIIAHNHNNHYITTFFFFIDLRTQHSQRKYFVDHFGMILPKEIILPAREEDVGRARTGHGQSLKRKSYMVVSLLAQLEALLNKADFYDEIFNSARDTVPGQSTRYEDGNFFKSSSFFQSHPSALQILLYVDEVQMCDPLASRTINNKLVFVYFTVGNLDPKHRSCLRHIHLLSIFLNKHVKTYGINFLLKPIIEELKLLEDGVDMNIKGRVVKIFGTLALLTADNLASHEVGGFKKGFARGKRLCRHCLTTNEETQYIFEDRKLIPRDRESHDRQCEALNDPNLSLFFWKSLRDRQEVCS